MKQFTLADLLPAVLAGNVVERGGITRYESGARSHPEGHHIHEHHEVFVILQGSGHIEIDGARTPFQAGDVFLVAPGEDHHVISEGELPLQSAWMHVRSAT